jgi:hypothetical protein
MKDVRTVSTVLVLVWIPSRNEHSVEESPQIHGFSRDGSLALLLYDSLERSTHNIC